MDRMLGRKILPLSFALNPMLVASCKVLSYQWTISISSISSLPHVSYVEPAEKVCSESFCVLMDPG